MADAAPRIERSEERLVARTAPVLKGRVRAETEERLEVRKVPWVVEEIHLRRREVTERRSVTDTVRHEAFDIQTDGDVLINSNPRARK